MSITTDLERGTQKMPPVVERPNPRGFALVASKINSDADKTTTIYRRFDALSARNLLFYQADLAELESSQKDLDENDILDNSFDAIGCQSDWITFKKAAAKYSGRNKEKMELALHIREVLEIYRM